MKRWLKIVAAGALLLPVLAGGLVVTALRTEVGAGWLLGLVRERVPGLEYARHEGSLADGIILQGARFRQDGLEAGADRLHLAVAPQLFPLVIKLRAVELDALRIVLPKENSDAAPVPESLALPFKVVLEQLRIDGLQVVDAEGAELFAANEILAAGEFFDQAVLSRAEMVVPQGSLRAAGRVGLSQPYDVDVEASAEFEQVVDGSVAPLLIMATGGLRGAIGAYELVIDGNARLDRFELDADGVVDLQRQRFEGRAGWRDFTWPFSGEPATFTSGEGSVELSGWLDGWSAEGQAGMAAPGLVDGTLSFVAEGDQGRARIVVPEGRVLGGRIEGEGEVDWSQGGGFRARIDLDEVATTPLYPDLPAVLTGELNVAGGLEPLTLDLRANALSADMQTRVVTADGRAAYRPGEWRFDRFTVRSAGSRVELDGSLDRAEGISFLADIADLDEFLEGASGRIAGSGRYAVSGGEQRLELDLAGDGLAWQGVRAEQARVVLAAPREASHLADLEIELIDASNGESRLERVLLEARLGRQEQAFELELAHGAYRLAASLPGSIGNLDDNWREWRWRGRLDAFRIDGPQEKLLDLQESAALELSLTEASLESTCLGVAGRARSCGQGRWSAASGVSASATLDSVPLGLLGLVAPNFELTQAVDGEAEFRLAPGATPEIDARFTLSPGEIRFVNDPRPLLQTGEGRIGLRVVEGAIRSGTFGLPITGQGRIDLDYRVEDLEAGLQAPVSGRLVADFEDLDVLAMFIPIADELGGRLDADLLLSGTLERPFLRGRLDLADGLVRHLASGMTLSDIQVSGQVDGSGVISLSGQFRAVEGLGHLEGLADISDLLDPSVNLDLSGEGLKLFDTQDLQLVIDPDIRLAWHEGALHVDGRLAVPRALIAPSVLPATPVVESPDVEIVSGQLPEAKSVDRRRQSVKVFGTLDVVLGEEVDIDLSVTEADLTGQARFEWSGPVLPMADGGFDLSGIILAFGQRLEITQGRIGFPGGPADNPYLNVRAEREIYGNSEVRRAGLWVTGTLKRPQIEPYTDPMTTRERARTLLVTGSDFNMERGSGAVSVGTYIAPRIFISYGVGVFDDENVISVRYDLGRGWGVMATSGERQTGVDMSYTIER